MADNTYIKNDFTGFNFGYEFYNGKQIFKNAWTQNVIDDEVAKMRHSGLISDTDLAIVKFTFHNSFITARIARDLFMPEQTVEKVGEMLERLLKNRLLNKFAVSSARTSLLMLFRFTVSIMAERNFSCITVTPVMVQISGHPEAFLCPFPKFQKNFCLLTSTYSLSRTVVQISNISN